MKKFILMALVLGVYSMPLSASDVDSDYSMSNEECLLTGDQVVMEHTVDPASANTRADELNAQEYDEDAAWVGATHRHEFDEFGYDDE